MNILEKAYCRIYQFGFRLAGPFLPYREPDLYNKISHIPHILKDKKINSVLIVTDEGVQKSGHIFILKNILQGNNIKVSIYDKTQANPTIDNVEDGFSLYKANKCQALIGFGGGSSMDCAKAIGARAAYPKKSINDLKGLLKVLRKIPFLIAIPTTSGTGSEVTVTAVITDAKVKHKYTLNNFTFIPYVAILDPKVTYTMPVGVTATTGMDALTHAVEAYIGKSNTRETKKLAKEAIKMIFKSLYVAYKNGNNFEARSDMLLASYKAGIAFSKAYVGYVHAVAHSLGGQYNVPHGLANAVILPYVLEEYGSCIYKKLHELAICVGISDKNENREIGAKKFIEAIRSLNSKLNIPNGFDVIKDEDITMMSKYAAKEANPLYPVPKLMNAKELEKIYRIIQIKKEK